MRVITGKYRGKRLDSPEGNSVRPTTDRVKETMFNMLCSRGYGDDIAVLDLFAGSGSLGIEALSRGAKSCVFVDKDRKSSELVRSNLKIVGASAEVFNTDYSVALSRLIGKQFDLIILDPPYNDNLEKKITDLIFEYDVLAKDGLVMVEHSSSNSLDGVEEKYDIDSRKCGGTIVSFLSYK